MDIKKLSSSASFDSFLNKYTKKYSSKNSKSSSNKSASKDPNIIYENKLKDKISDLAKTIIQIKKQKQNLNENDPDKAFLMHMKNHLNRMEKTTRLQQSHYIDALKEHKNQVSGKNKQSSNKSSKSSKSSSSNKKPQSKSFFSFLKK